MRVTFDEFGEEQKQEQTKGYQLGFSLEAHD